MFKLLRSCRIRGNLIPSRSNADNVGSRQTRQPAAPSFAREAFKTSRLADFASQKELVAQARAALAPFHDPRLDQRNDARAERWRRAAQRRLDSDLHAAAARRRIERAHKALQRAIASFNGDVASARVIGSGSRNA
jgi:hypothetical protein